MTALTGNTIASTYKDLLQVSNNNGGIDTTMRPVSDGEGTASALQINNAAVNINGTFQLNGESITVAASAINNMANIGSATGIIAVTGGDVYGRTLIAGTPVSITNANGTTGNPTITLASIANVSGSYGPFTKFAVNDYGQIVSATDTEVSVSIATLRTSEVITETVCATSYVNIGGDTSIAGALVVNGIVSANNNFFIGGKLVAATEVSVVNQLNTSNLYAASAIIDDLSAGNLNFTAVSISVLTVNQLTVVSVVSAASLNFTSLSGTGAVTITDILDEDNMASNSATKLSTQQSIKAYVDAQVDTVDTLAETLAIGNTSGGTDLAISAGDDITFTDSSKAIFGAGGDLEIYHNGSNTYINETGTGKLIILATDLTMADTGNAHNYLNAVSGAGVTLYYDNNSRIATTATGVTITGEAIATGFTGTLDGILGSGSASAATVTALEVTSLSGTGAVAITDILDEDNMASNSATKLSTQQSIKAYVDAQVDTVDTLAETLAIGNTSGGTDLAISAGDDITFTDSSKAIFGAGGDLEIYHNGSNTYINETGTGKLIILATDLTMADTGNAHNYLNAVSGGGVTLYYDNNSKIATTATGVTITGVATATTFEPNGDTAAGDNAAIGYTAAEGLILTGQGSTSDITLKNDADATVFTVPTGTDDILFPDGAKAMFGAGSDLQIYHDGNSNITDAGTGDLILRASNDIFLSNVAGSSIYGRFAEGGAVSLYHNGSVKFVTAATGVTITGEATATGFTGTLDGVLGGGTPASATVTTFTSNGINDDASVNAVNFLSTGEVIYGHTARVTSYGTNPGLQKVGTNSASGAVSINRFQASASGAHLTFAHARGSVGVMTALQSADFIGEINFTGSDGTDLANRTAYIGAIVDGSVASNSVPTSLVFGTGATSSASERMRITSSGEALIGTTSTGSKLRVSKGSSSNAVLFEGTGYQTYFGYGASEDNYISSGTSGSTIFRIGSTERMRINSSGNVGIGTSAPGEALEVYRNAATTHARIKINNPHASAYNSELSLVTNSRSWLVGAGDDAIGIDAAGDFHVYDATASAYRLVIKSTGSVGIGTTDPSTYGTLAVRLSTSSNVPVLGMSVTGTSPLLNHYITDSGSTVRTLNQILFGTGSTNSANYQGYLAFKTASSAATPAERMRITATGNVGIGTTAPGSILEVMDSAASLLTVLQVHNQNSGAGTAAAIGFNTSYAGDTSVPKAGIGMERTGAQGRGPMHFYQDVVNDVNPFSASDIVMTLTNTGHLGIGTTAPATTLHVVGDATITDDVKLLSDSAILSFGADSEVTLSHVHDVGLAQPAGQTIYRGAAGDFDAAFTSRNNVHGQSDFEWGHLTGGYGNTLGSHVGSGAGFICFHGGRGSSSNTYQTHGQTGCGFQDNNNRILTFFSLDTADADNQSPTTRITLNGTNGNLVVSGALSKGSGSFRITHPLESKEDTHDLVHSFIEGPQADLIYRGRVTLSGGSATVNIDTSAGMTAGTFDVLCRDVQCFTSNESGWTCVRGSVSGATLTIESEAPDCTDTISWMVVGERKDHHMIDTDWTDENGKVIVEPEQVDEEIVNIGE